MIQLALPIPVDVARDRIIVPALAKLPPKMQTPRAHVMLLAIAQQESGLAARRQGGNGPARGLWQFELGGVGGVMQHSASSGYLKDYCDSRQIAFVRTTIYNLLETDDELACVVARLLLYTLPQALPVIGDAPTGWKQYIEAWRPGKPHAITWDRNYRNAAGAIP